MKYIKLLLIILTIGFLSLGVNSVVADSGFSSSSGGSHHSSSSSHHSSSRSSSSSSSSSSGRKFSEYSPKTKAIIAAVMCFYVSLFIFCLIIKRKVDGKGLAPKYGEYELDKKIRDELLGSDFDNESFKQEAFNIYKDIQIAWMNNDLESVRTILDTNLFNQYQTQILTLTTKGEKNMMEDIELKNCFIVDVDFSSGKEIITVCLEVFCRDYFVNSEGHVIRGNKNRKRHYLYEIKYIRDKEENINNCPNCGAPLIDAANAVCSQCNSVITKQSRRLRMLEKRMITEK